MRRTDDHFWMVWRYVDHLRAGSPAAAKKRSIIILLLWFPIHFSHQQQRASLTAILLKNGDCQTNAAAAVFEQRWPLLCHSVSAKVANNVHLIYLTIITLTGYYYSFTGCSRGASADFRPRCQFQKPLRLADEPNLKTQIVKTHEPLRRQRCSMQ